jgi:hypothetical protein
MKQELEHLLLDDKFVHELKRQSLAISHIVKEPESALLSAIKEDLVAVKNPAAATRRLREIASDFLKRQ